jgi:predicted Zn-ribbon and HTH transcriptional regulator
MGPEPPIALTRRQQIVDLLHQQEYGFEGLRAELRISVRALEEDLHHVERTLHRGTRKLVVKPASCWACGYLFKGRAPKHFHTPSRCPRCRSEDIADARLRVEDRNG